jgi:rare lipoprotein A
MSAKDSIGGRSVATWARAGLVALAGASLAACATSHGARPGRTADARPGAPSAPGEAALGGRYKLGAPYQVGGVWYVPADQPDYEEVGVASWYGDEFNGERTANGERFDMYAASAAHTTLPLPSIVEVTNLENGRSMRLRLNDRGPFKGGRIIDVSRAAARELGFERQGIAKVRVRYIGPAKLDGSLEPLYVARRDRDRVSPWSDASPVRVAAAAPPPPPVQAKAPAVAPSAEPEPAPYVRPTPKPSIAVAELAPPPGPPPAYPAETWTPPAPEGPAYKPAAYTTEPRYTPEARYAVQAASFSDPDRAQRLASQLSSAGTASVRAVEVDSRLYYRVVLGPWAYESDAEAAREEVAALGVPDARVVTAF